MLVKESGRGHSYQDKVSKVCQSFIIMSDLCFYVQQLVRLLGDALQSGSGLVSSSLDK